ncbi:Steroid C26-monooxygenase [Sinobacterium norvegicum]|uniref:Steroid C26-monooxygenase n=1 Tax=Sinobacterium norvegicum TaxID=1641715 RepID=A0ABM9AEF7_9GAMM|nr:cytochrome P450 [Sinobacterium norvegicum]CAH0991086.1 Steroid C26-monooxygenase [Sinobacterium norvegicum]
MTTTELDVEQIDIYNPDNYIDGVPHAQFQTLRQQSPVHWHDHPDGGGFWVVSRHADVMAVSRDHQTFSAQEGFVLIDDLPEEVLPMVQGQLLGMDPPNHGPIRRAVISRFTSKMLAELEPKVREITRGILQAAHNKKDCNFVYDVAGELPTAVIGSMLDVPENMWHQMREWSDMQTSASDPDIGGTPEQVTQASIEMGTYGFELACQRKDQPGEDLISLLINVEVDGRKIDEAEFAGLFVQLAVAGNETTRALISTGMYQLIKHPELYQQLEADPSKLKPAIEEMLRWSCPLHHFRRTATTNCEIGGQQIAKGDKVVMLYSSANFDEQVFDRPEQFDIGRDSNPHMAFGHGIHLCLGANLARMETRIFFEEFFTHFKGIELTGEAKRIRSNLVNGFKEMPVRLIPR